MARLLESAGSPDLDVDVVADEELAGCELEAVVSPAEV
jgi:hypothetical protein